MSETETGLYPFPTKEDVQYFKDHIRLGTHRHNIRHSFPNTFTGKEAMSLMQSMDGFHESGAAVNFGTMLIQAGVIIPANFQFHRYFCPKSRYLYRMGQGRDFENLFWVYHDEEENGPATLSAVDMSKHVYDGELSPEEAQQLKEIPSVGGLPIAGVALKLASPGDMNRSMQRLGRELCPQTNGLFRMTLMGHKFVVVSDPEYAERIFVSDCFGKKTEHDAFFHEMRVFRGEGLSSASDGVLHDQVSSLIAPNLIKKAFERYVPTALETIHDSLQELRKQGSFEARPFFYKVLLRTIGKVVVGTDIYGGNPEWDFFIKGITIVANQSVNRAFKGAKLAPNQALKFRRTVERMNDFLLQVVQERREKLQRINKPEKDYDLLDLMLTTPVAENDGQKIYMSDELVRANVETILSAQNTTVAMLSWTMNFLYDWSLGNSDSLYKLLQEVDNLSQGDRNYQPTLEDVYKHMHHMTNVFYESLRLCPPIPTVIRHCIKTCNVGGYVVRRGDTVMVSALGTHLNPKSFDDPWTYKPDRWNKPDCKKMPCSLVVWAAGRRQCIGREYALLTGRLVMFCLLNQFSLEMSSKSKVVTNEHLFVFPDGLILNARPRAQMDPLESPRPSPNSQRKQENGTVMAEGNEAKWEGLKTLVRQEGYRILVAKGSNSAGGTVDAAAHWLTEKALKFGFKTDPEAITLNDLHALVRNEKPQEFTIWALVTASYNGKPPDNAKAFYDWLEDKAQEGDTRYLENVSYFLYGCGSTNWVATYQKVPHAMDKLMQKLGARRIAEPAVFNEANDELEDVSRDYYKVMAPALMHSLPAIGDQKLRKVDAKYRGEELAGRSISDSSLEDFTHQSRLEAQASSSAFSMKVMGTTDDVEAPFIPTAHSLRDHEVLRQCPVKSITNLTPNSDRATMHVCLERCGLEYRTGDHLVVFPLVAREYAQRLLSHFTDFALDTVIAFESYQANEGRASRLPIETNISVENVLRALVDLKRKPSKQFVINYSAIVDKQEDREFLARIANNRQSFVEWVDEQQPLSIIDVVDRYPPSPDNFDRLVEILPDLAPRKYSITSSPNVHADEIHLCCAIEDETFAQGTYEGLCSQYWLALQKEEKPRVYAHVERADDSFRVPADDKPMILISAGTGFAPMRGFLHEREHRHASGKNLVFFGCRTRAHDLLFADELKAWEEASLAEFHYAFSREGKKQYVQDVMKEQHDTLWRLIDEEQAFIYVCGSGSTMSVGVREALIDIIKDHVQGDAEQAEAYFSKLERANRYVIDVWG